MDIVIIVTVIASLFLIIGIAEPLANRLRLPYSVILAVLGILLWLGSNLLLRADLPDSFDPVAEAILEFPIRSNIFLYVFLPTLLFQVTLGMNLRRMMDDRVPIIVLAVVAVAVATFTVGMALSFASTLPLVACLLIGSIVSTTDPSAVVSIFRSISAPRRLSRIIEGESLLNDAAAIALFGLFMSFVMLGVPDPSITEALLHFPVLIAGGAFAGWFAARIAIQIMSMLGKYDLALNSVSVALPYLAYICAEQILGASGVIAVVTAGITLNLVGPGRLPPRAWTNLREVWDLLAHWAGALIFILAALLIPRLLEGVRMEDFVLVGVVILAAIASRAAILFGLLPLLTRAGLSSPVNQAYRTAILWGGLRGAVTLALALAVTESLRVPIETRRVVGILATGFTLFTLLVQGTTLRMVIRWLGLDRLSPLDEAISRQVVAVALQSVREDVARTTEDYRLSHEVVRSEAKIFGDRLEACVKMADDSEDIVDRDRITLGLIALAGYERDKILERVRESTISAGMAEKTLLDADRLIEGARSGGRNGYQQAARRSISYGRTFRLAVFLHTRLGFSRPLARMTADRFETLLSQSLTLRDLDSFIEGRIRRIHGRRVADLLIEMLARRVEGVERSLEGLRLQYPGYAEKLERRFIRSTALRLEEREYTAMREDGLIGSEVFSTLIRTLEERRVEAERRPHLDIALQWVDLVRQFPMFSDLEDKEVAAMSRAFRTKHINDGTFILKMDDVVRQVFFIASGAVEMEKAGKTWKFGRGEMFGHVAALSGQPNKVEVRAIAPTTLLLLDMVRFRNILSRSRSLKSAVAKSAAQRGVDADVLLKGAIQLHRKIPGSGAFKRKLKKSP